MKMLLQVLWLAINSLVCLINCRVFFPLGLIRMFIGNSLHLNYFSSECLVFPSYLHPKMFEKTCFCLHILYILYKLLCECKQLILYDFYINFIIVHFLDELALIYVFGQGTTVY